MTMEPKQLDAFLAVKEMDSFTKAADKLYITQSALSQRIQKLEAQLGLLFIREKNHIYPTELANKLAIYCQRKSLLESEFLSEVQNDKGTQLSGAIRIGGISSALKAIIIPRLALLLKKNTELYLEIHEYEEREILNALFKNQVDYVVSSNRLYRHDLKTIQIGVETYILVERQNNTNQNTFLDNDSCDETTTMFLQQQKSETKPLKIHYLDNIHLIIEACKAGIGRAVLPKACLLTHPELIEVPHLIPLEIPVFMMYLVSPYYTKLQNAVLKALL